MIKHFTKTLSQKQKSLRTLYSTIYKMGSITKADLSKQTGLKLTTCTRLIDELLQMGLIKESGHAISSGGRKPVLYNIQANAYYTIGIDISRTYSKVLLMDLESNVLEEARFDID